MQLKKVEPTDQTFDMVKNYQKDVLRKLRYERSHNRQTRNECFKLTRECRQWLKQFRLDKNAVEAKGSNVKTSTADTKSQSSNSELNVVEHNSNTSMEKEKPEKRVKTT